MFTNPHNQNLINDVMRVLNGDTTERPINPVPQWISEAAEVTADEIRQYARGRVMTLELQRDILRKNLSEAISGCDCAVSSETPIQFEEEVRRVLDEKAAEAVVPGKPTKIPSHKASELATPSEVQSKTKNPATGSMPKNTGLASTGKNPAKIGEDYELNEAFALPSEADLKKSIKQLEDLLKDKAKLKQMKMDPKDANKRLVMLKGIYEFGKSFAKVQKKIEKEKGDTKKESVEHKFSLFLNLLEDRELGALGDIIENLLVDDQNNIQEVNWNDHAE